MLALKLLDNVTDVNTYEVATVVSFNTGVDSTVYFQFCQPGRNGLRYIPATGATVSVTIWNINDAKKVIRTATQPYPTDPSIWSISLLSTDPILGTPGILAVLTEGTKATSVFLQGALRFNSSSILE